MGPCFPIWLHFCQLDGSIACPKLPLTLIICDRVQYQVGSTGYCLAST